MWRGENGQGFRGAKTELHLSPCKRESEAVALGDSLRILRLVHAAILAALSDFGPLAQYELADRLDIQPSHLVGYVDLLVQRELVQRGAPRLTLLTRVLEAHDQGRRGAVV